MSAQLALDLEAASETDPLTCPWRRPVPSIARDVCTKDGREVYTQCSTGLWGEPPRCTLREPDNSPEACARRLAWAEAHPRTSANEEEHGPDL